MRMAPIIAAKAVLHAALACKVKSFTFLKCQIMRCTRAVIRQAAIGLLHLLQTPRKLACVAGVIGMVMLGEPHEGRADIGG